MSKRTLGICDRCGLRYRHMELRKEWTNLMVCDTCWEEKHPQLMPTAKRLGDPYPVKDARPEQPIETASNADFDNAFPHTAGGGT